MTRIQQWAQGACALALLMLQAPGAGAAETPTPPSRPVTVRIELKSIDRINSLDQTFRANFYLFANWEDPARCRTPGPAAAKAWRPEFEFINASDKVDWRREATDVSNDAGHCQVAYWALIVGTFQSEMQLRRFPFDVQTFPIIIESYEHELDAMRFNFRPAHAAEPQTQLYTAADTIPALCDSATGSPACKYFTDPTAIRAIPEWQFQSFGVELGVHEYPLENHALYSRATFTLQMARKPGFYIWKVMVPLFLIAALSWLIFLTGCEDFLKRLGAVFTLFLSSVTFSLFTKSTLPAISYLVLIDCYTLGTYFMIFISALVSAVVYRLSVQSRRQNKVQLLELGEAIDTWSLRVFPAGYVLYCVLCTGFIL